MIEQLYSLQFVADKLNISVRNLKRLIEKKKLPVILIGRQIRIEESTVEKLLIRVEPISLEAQNLTL